MNSNSVHTDSKNCLLWAIQNSQLLLNAATGDILELCLSSTPSNTCPTTYIFYTSDNHHLLLHII